MARARTIPPGALAGGPASYRGLPAPKPYRPTPLVPVVPAPAAVDWHSFLDSFGMPDDVKAQLDRIFRQGGDINNLIAVAQAYVRGTPWYAQTYPGISEGISRGLVGDEKGYRSYLNDANQLYQQYYGRSVGGDEFANLLRSGVGPSLLHSQLEAHADAEAYGAQLPHGLFSADELQQIGMDQAGIGSAAGKRLNDISSYARQLNPIYRQYAGRDITRGELEGHYGAQDPAGTVEKRFAGSAYVSAYGQDINYAAGNFGGGQLTGEQLQSLGEEQVGLDTEAGQRLQRAFNSAMQRMQGAFRSTPLTQLSQSKIGPDAGR